eukprot:CFRG4247T1
MDILDSIDLTDEISLENSHVDVFGTPPIYTSDVYDDSDEDMPLLSTALSASDNMASRIGLSGNMEESFEEPVDGDIAGEHVKQTVETKLRGDQREIVDVEKNKCVDDGAGVAEDESVKGSTRMDVDEEKENVGDEANARVEIRKEAGKEIGSILLVEEETEMEKLFKQLPPTRPTETIRVEIDMERARDFSLLDVLNADESTSQSRGESESDGGADRGSEGMDVSAVGRAGRSGGMTDIIAKIEALAKQQAPRTEKLDMYDLDDDWIDDSELVDDVVTAQTRHGGFYVNVGPVEEELQDMEHTDVLELGGDDDFDRPIKRKRKRKESVAEKVAGKTKKIMKTSKSTKTVVHVSATAKTVKKAGRTKKGLSNGTSNLTGVAKQKLIKRKSAIEGDNTNKTPKFKKNIDVVGKTGDIAKPDLRTIAGIGGKPKSAKKKIAPPAENIASHTVKKATTNGILHATPTRTSKPMNDISSTKKDVEDTPPYMKTPSDTLKRRKTVSKEEDENVFNTLDEPHQLLRIAIGFDNTYDMNALEKALDDGADPNAVISILGTATHVLAATPREHVAMACDMYTILVGKGLVVDLPNSDMDSALHIALHMERIQLKLVRKLIELGIHVDTLDKQGRTVLHIAAMRLKAKTCVALVKKGANLHVKDKHGNTAKDLAEREWVGDHDEEYIDLINTLTDSLSSTPHMPNIDTPNYPKGVKASLGHISQKAGLGKHQQSKLVKGTPVTPKRLQKADKTVYTDVPANEFPKLLDNYKKRLILLVNQDTGRPNRGKVTISDAEVELLQPAYHLAQEHLDKFQFSTYFNELAQICGITKTTLYKRVQMSALDKQLNEHLDTIRNAIEKTSDRLDGVRWNSSIAESILTATELKKDALLKTRKIQQKMHSEMLDWLKSDVITLWPEDELTIDFLLENVPSLYVMYIQPGDEQDAAGISTSSNI